MLNTTNFLLRQLRIFGHYELILYLFNISNFSHLHKIGEGHFKLIKWKMMINLQREHFIRLKNFYLILIWQIREVFRIHYQMQEAIIIIITIVVIAFQVFSNDIFSSSIFWFYLRGGLTNSLTGWASPLFLFFHRFISYYAGFICLNALDWASSSQLLEFSFISHILESIHLLDIPVSHRIKPWRLLSTHRIWIFLLQL
jgi:hypothetical protein